MASAGRKARRAHLQEAYRKKAMESVTAGVNSVKESKESKKAARRAATMAEVAAVVAKHGGGKPSSCSSSSSSSKRAASNKKEVTALVASTGRGSAYRSSTSGRVKVKVQLTKGKRAYKMYRAKPGAIPAAANISGLAQGTIAYRLRRAKELSKMAGRHRFEGSTKSKWLFVTPAPPRRKRKDRGKKRSVAPRMYHGAKKAYPDVEL